MLGEAFAEGDLHIHVRLVVGDELHIRHRIIPRQHPAAVLALGMVRRRMRRLPAWSLLIGRARTLPAASKLIGRPREAARTIVHRHCDGSGNPWSSRSG